MAIWQLVLPYRGMHWVEIEGLAHEAPYVRDSIRFTRHRCPDGNLPETLKDFWSLPKCDEHQARYDAYNNPGLFFQYLVPVVPSVWGAAGPQKEHGDGDLAEQVAEEVAYARRCRQLSTYNQVTTLLSTCRLSRTIALEYIQKYYPHLCYVYRSKGLLHRPRSLDLWEAQYLGFNEPDYGPPHWNLVPVIRAPLDLIVLRLHDRHGRATPMLRQSLYQFSPEPRDHPGVSKFPFFNLVAIEWHPRWAAPGPDGRDQFLAANVRAVMRLMHSCSSQGTILYWLVDGVPRPNWKRDYPEEVRLAFEMWMARFTKAVFRNQKGMDEDTKAAFLVDCDLNLEFEANGRRYYVVFVVIPWHRWPALRPGYKAKNVAGPFAVGEAIWPETLRAPARFAYDMLTDEDLDSLGTHRHMSLILSWEPI